MATRNSGPLDALVGDRIRMLRVNRGMSQAMLAGRIGVTFQQVQRYEQGASRVGASRLARVAAALGVSVSALFESSRTDSPRVNSPVRRLAEPGALRVLNAVARTAHPRVRPCITKPVEGIAARTPGTKAKVVRLPASDRGERRLFPSRR